ncbi:MAG TPA: GWxTD domain-containing protein, partial [Bacteroidota bacterium]|nr:GWxTD domain-containing protein [Bacteroidota bacterium]
SAKEYLRGIFSFSVLPGTYTLVTDIRNIESNRRNFDKSRTVTVKDFSATPSLSDIFFSYSESSADDSLIRLTDFGEVLPLGSNVFSSVLVHTGATPRESVNVSYKISGGTIGDFDTTTIISGHPSASEFIPVSGLSISDHDTNAAILHLHRSPDHSASYLVRWRIQGDTLPEGQYEEKVFVTSGASHTEQVRRFSVRWIDMPRSLRSMERAVEVLLYIAPDSVMNALHHLHGDDLERAFRQFWKDRDPTPHSAYNEAMAEYYRRVDHAVSAFATIGQDDGFKTERGRAYIIYGAPDKTERAFDSSGRQTELWYYTALKKRLVFVDQAHRGDYRLVSIDDL